MGFKGEKKREERKLSRFLTYSILFQRLHIKALNDPSYCMDSLAFLFDSPDGF